MENKLIASLNIQSLYINITVKNRGARGVMVTSQDMDTAIRVQILNLTDCISHSTNTLGKGMNPNILPPAMGK